MFRCNYHFNICYKYENRRIYSVFGYEEKDILPAIIKAIETKKPMPGMHEIIEEEVGITDEDRKDGKGIIL